MGRMMWTTGLFAGLAMLAAGCGGDDGPQLAEAGGIVTYNGEPLKGANVVFMPDAGGPAAYGTTGADGHFTWMTRGQTGAMVGTGKVAITAFEELAEPKEEHELTAEDLKKLNTSRIPENYGRVENSGLTATVTADGENSFTFGLTG